MANLEGGVSTTSQAACVGKIGIFEPVSAFFSVNSAKNGDGSERGVNQKRKSGGKTTAKFHDSGFRHSMLTSEITAGTAVICSVPFAGGMELCMLVVDLRLKMEDETDGKRIGQ